MVRLLNGFDGYLRISECQIIVQNALKPELKPSNNKAINQSKRADQRSALFD
jgi:hypothetical protein